MKVNINWQCRIILKERGVEILHRYAAEYYLLPRKQYKVGDVIEKPLWEIMHIFGQSCYMGPVPPFETTIEIIEE